MFKKWFQKKKKAESEEREPQRQLEVVYFWHLSYSEGKFTQECLTKLGELIEECAFDHLNLGSYADRFIEEHYRKYISHLSSEHHLHQRYYQERHVDLTYEEDVLKGAIAYVENYLNPQEKEELKNKVLNLVERSTVEDRKVQDVSGR